MPNSELIHQLQSLEIDEPFLFTKGLSGVDLSQKINYSDLLIRKTNRTICLALEEEVPFELCDRLPSVDCYGYQSSFTQLGSLLMELLFSELSFIEIELSNELSEIRQFFVYVDREKHRSIAPFVTWQQREKIKSLEYYPHKLERYPYDYTMANEDLPTFRLGCSNDQDFMSKDWLDKADQLILSTSVTGLVNMAELFLNIGNVENKQDEICLENPLFGVGGVSPTSIEARFWLPGSFAFYTEQIEDLSF